jgi:hypothetical protein
LFVSVLEAKVNRAQLDDLDAWEQIVKRTLEEARIIVKGLALHNVCRLAIALVVSVTSVTLPPHQSMTRSLHDPV